MKLYVFLIFCFIALVLTTSYSCDELGVIEEDTVSCPKRWSVFNYQNVSYVIGDSALYLFSNTMANGMGIEFVNLDTLTGDFEVNIDFHNYYVHGGSLGFFVQLIAHAPNGLPNNSVKATIGNVFPGLFGTRVGVGIDSAGTDPVIVAYGNYANASDTSGFFTIRRTGTTMELTASTGDSSATITGGFYSTPLTISIQYGANFNPTIANNSVTLRRFRVNDGGGSVIDDYFDCNSIQ